MVHALGLADTPADAVLRWYDAIVGDVTEITAGRSRGDAGRTAFAELQARLRPSLEGGPESSLLAVAAREAGGLLPVEVLSNAGVLLFGGIETTEGMISNAILHVLSDPAARRLVQADATLLANAVEESLRLEPAAAVVDRYATRDVALAGSHIRAGELVRVSLAAAGRDPNTFPEPDRFDVRRPNAQQHLAFAQGPHVCLGMHLARVEARAALAAVLELPGVRLDPARPSVVRGLVFRKPQTLHVVWDAGG
jgi:cytochrome P450